MNNTFTLWQGRFAGAADPAAQSFTASIELDRHLAAHDVRYSRAHAAALHRAGLLSDDEAEALGAALRQVGEEIAAGTLPLDEALEDIHTHVERRVTELAGSAGARLHTGRSRNDQVATDMRLFIADAIDAARVAIRRLQGALLERAEEHVETILPAYTHLQRAQPVSLAHHLLAYLWMLERDHERLGDARRRAATCPAGAGACAGTGIPLDRAGIAQELGLGQPMPNSLDAATDRDFLIEFLAAATICLGHTSRLAADLCLWATAEFGFVRLPERFCTGSSMMPQKVNPDVLELVRSKVAVAAADLGALVGVLHGLPLGYQRDLQEDKGPMLRGAHTLVATLDILSPVIAEARFETDRMAAAAADPALLATDWAEELVLRGVPFRDAHRAVGRLLLEAAAAGHDPRSMSTEKLSGYSPHLADAVAAVPGAAAAVARKVTEGSTGTGPLRRQLQEAARCIADGGPATSRTVAGGREARSVSNRPTRTHGFAVSGPLGNELRDHRPEDRDGDHEADQGPADL